MDERKIAFSKVEKHDSTYAVILDGEPIGYVDKWSDGSWYPTVSGKFRIPGRYDRQYNHYTRKDAAQAVVDAYDRYVDHMSRDYELIVDYEVILTKRVILTPDTLKDLVAKGYEVDLRRGLSDTIRDVLHPKGQLVEVDQGTDIEVSVRQFGRVHRPERYTDVPRH